ncbi:MAG: hypothetical protein AB1391_01145 [Candidatus Micrarchaeota archaeon]
MVVTPNAFKEKIFDEKKEILASSKSEMDKPKKLGLFSDLENVEIKKLSLAELDDVYTLMRKTLWEISKQQITDILKLGMSYGAYVERMLVGVGFGWPVFYDEKNGDIVNGEPNAIYLEDVALLLMYEGREIREMLVDEREKCGKASNYVYAVAYISPDWPQGNLEDMIRDRGNKIERVYLGVGYQFIRTANGIIAIKRI